MSTTKLPIQTKRGPSRRPVPGGALVSEVAVDHGESFDFRSSRFCDDAQTLARTTGRALQSYRQELFIAEGDMGLAYEWLVRGYEGEAVANTWH